MNQYFVQSVDGLADEEQNLGPFPAGEGCHPEYALALDRFLEVGRDLAGKTTDGQVDLVCRVGERDLVLLSLIVGIPRFCRVCGCTEDDACIGENGVTCGWAEDDLCTACVGKESVAA